MNGVALRWRIGVLIAGWLFFGNILAANLEAKIQAAYLYNFTKFIEWPRLPKEFFTICVVGADAVREILGDLADRPVKGRPLKIAQGSLADLEPCQVLYLGQAAGRFSDWLHKTEGSSVLTVSDAPDFAHHGGVIGFYPEDGKVKLEINTYQAQSRHLKISAKLMEIARILP